ncbi:hypothetical protein Ddye_019971 [Dipteronia dyeriana]|uniref:FAR1 domain-containing protein n=1 Tax=Dipteronia dyeriana TaxID=168575 RepID=A0AAD9WVK7_9ROSI|nr:hypothetical protein Ddye_019971 [Dipteronia dyeriana]
MPPVREKGKGESITEFPNPEDPERWALFGSRRIWPEREISMTIVGNTFIPKTVNRMGRNRYVRKPNMAALEFVREFYCAMVAGTNVHGGGCTMFPSMTDMGKRVYNELANHRGARLLGDKGDKDDLEDDPNDSDYNAEPDTDAVKDDEGSMMDRMLRAIQDMNLMIMRKDRLCRDTYGLITVRRWVCSKEGYRSKKNIERTDRVRGPRGQTREGCRAALKINVDREKMLWVVIEFGNEHFHKLLSSNHGQFLPSHRHVDDYDIAQVQSLRSVGVKTSQVMFHLLDQSESYADVGQSERTYKTSWTPYVDIADILEVMHGKCPNSMVTDGDRAMSKALIYGSLSFKCSKMSYFAVKSTDGFKAANMAIDKLTIQMHGLLPTSTTTREENADGRRTQSSVQIKDSVIAATKGSIKKNKKSSGKTRKYGKYGQAGHTTKTCCAHVNNNINTMAGNGDGRTGSTS